MGANESKEVIYDMAKELDSTIVPEIRDMLRIVKYINEFLKIFDKEELIPVGSSQDGSKVNIPGDGGDMDVLLISKTIFLDEALFDYDITYPSFLRLRGDGVHSRYFKRAELIDNKWVSVNVIKEINKQFCALLHVGLSMISLLPNIGVKPTAVGYEIDHSKQSASELFDKVPSDIVPAFSFLGWPRPAAEWILRKRKWPTTSVVQAVISTGCQVVAKRPLFPYLQGDADNEKLVNKVEDTFLRLSFSRCELVLAKSLKEEQMLLWRILKAFQKGFLQTKPKVLASYHWKNIVFWISESLDRRFWKPNNLHEAILKALDFMITCLEKQCVPFYFVRGENLIAGCREDRINETLIIVRDIRRKPLVYLQQFLKFPPKPENKPSVSESGALLKARTNISALWMLFSYYYPKIFSSADMPSWFSENGTHELGFNDIKRVCKKAADFFWTMCNVDYDIGLSYMDDVESKNADLSDEQICVLKESDVTQFLINLFPDVRYHQNIVARREFYGVPSLESIEEFVLVLCTRGSTCKVTDKIKAFLVNAAHTHLTLIKELVQGGELVQGDAISKMVETMLNGLMRSCIKHYQKQVIDIPLD